MIFRLITPFLLLLAVNFIKAKSKSYGGTYAHNGQFPYAAVLLDGGYGCGASIFHERWVLTAGHCIHGDTNNRVLKVGTVDRLRSGTTYEVEAFYIHPDYTHLPENDNENLEYVVNDIGLLRVASKIVFNNNVWPVALATDAKKTYHNSMATLAGWGSTGYGERGMHPFLRFIRVRVLSLGECRKAWTYADKHVCTSNQDKQGVCYGDSGSALVVDGVQIGITSTSDTYCEAVKPDLYTKVASFVPWIEKILAKHGDVLLDS